MVEVRFKPLVLLYKPGTLVGVSGHHTGLGSERDGQREQGRAEGNEWEGTGQVPEGMQPGPAVRRLQGFSEQS